LYIDVAGVFAAQLTPYLNKVGIDPRVDDDSFKNLLRDAGKTDPKMHDIQDRLFDKYYYIPAMTWADANRFKLPLSALVIYDSYIQSGSVPDFLFKRFAEAPPVSGPIRCSAQRFIARHAFDRKSPAAIGICRWCR
jgi:chitosanase